MGRAGCGAVGPADTKVPGREETLAPAFSRVTLGLIPRNACLVFCLVFFQVSAGSPENLPKGGVGGRVGGASHPRPRPSATPCLAQGGTRDSPQGQPGYQGSTLDQRVSTSCPLPEGLEAESVTPAQLWLQNKAGKPPRMAGSGDLGRAVPAEGPAALRPSPRCHRVPLAVPSYFLL